MPIRENPLAAFRREYDRQVERADKDWCRIVVNKADGGQGASADVMLYDEIGFWGTTAQDFANQLGALDVGTINLHINSPGGEVYDGIAILNALRNHDATVNVTVDGIAASAASFIAMAGDTITMARNSELMIHDASGLVIGGPDDMAEFADRLNTMSDNIASIYAERAGGTVQDWRAAMKAETWYSAQEAVDAGLADKVQAKEPADQDAKNRFDLSIFNYAGRSKAPAPPIAPRNARTDTPAAASADGTKETDKEGSTIVAFSDESTATLRQKLGLADDADEATILAAVDEALDERAEPQNTTQLPEGVVAIDAAQLDELRVHAEAGHQARLQQETDHREQVVNEAVRTGRIAPARREAWLNRLKADPEEEATLNSLEPGLVPVKEVGTAVGLDDDTTDQPINDAEASALARMTGLTKEAFLRG